MDQKRQVIATLKALGASGGRVFAIYLAQVLLLALLGVAIGLTVGAALPFVIAGLLGSSSRSRWSRRLSRRAGARRALWPAHRAGVRAVAARPRP